MWKVLVFISIFFSDLVPQKKFAVNLWGLQAVKGWTSDTAAKQQYLCLLLTCVLVCVSEFLRLLFDQRYVSSCCIIILRRAMCFSPWPTAQHQMLQLTNRKPPPSGHSVTWSVLAAQTSKQEQELKLQAAAQRNLFLLLKSCAPHQNGTKVWSVMRSTGLLVYLINTVSIWPNVII